MSISKNILIYQINDIILLKMVTNDKNKLQLRDYNILKIVDSEKNNILFNENDIGKVENSVLCLEKKNIINRVEFTTVYLKTNVESNFHVYVQSIPRDLRIGLTMIYNLLNENTNIGTEDISVKRNLLNLISESKLLINSLDEYNLIINNIVNSLESINENDYFIQRLKNCTLDLVPFQENKNYCGKFWEEVRDNLLKENDGEIEQNKPWLKGIQPKYAIDPAFVDNVNNKNLDHDIIKKNNILSKDDSNKTTKNSFFNIPTGRGDSTSNHTPILSETYNIEDFSVQMFRFEELNLNTFEGEDKSIMNNNDNNNYPISDTKPSLNEEENGFPDKEKYLNFMRITNATGGNIGPIPTKDSNISDKNPWSEDIKKTLNLSNDEFNGGVAEGRPGGLNGEHYLWSEDYKPNKITSTSLTGIVTNNGFRDDGQSHQYKLGEFGPNGLYHNTFEADGFEPIKGTTSGIEGRFHPKMPKQLQESLWTLDGTFPPKLLKARYEESVICRIYNFLPISPENNRGFGLHTVSIHEHNGHNSSISDGFAQSYYFPGEYYDYLYSMRLSGYKTKNIEKTDIRAGGPSDWLRDINGNIIVKNGKKLLKDPLLTPGDYKETMSTHWAHDHMLDLTARNVYKGHAFMMNYYSLLDRGNEEIDDGVNLRFPSGTELAWGNRDFDVNLMIADKSWDKEGQLWFNPFNKNGFMADRTLVNWVYKPYFKVRSRRYRFRILNASVSRWYKYTLVYKRNDLKGKLLGPIDENGLVTYSYDCVPFHMIANDGNILMHSIKFDGTLGTTNATVPTHAIAERYDLIIDFSKFKEGDKLYFVNCLEHLNGKKPNRVVNLGEILNKTYNLNKNPGEYDPCVEKFIEFRVFNYNGIDKSVDPQIYEYGKGRPMIPMNIISEDMIKSAVQRRFDFINHQTEDGIVLSDEWAIETDNDGQSLQMDPRRISAAPRLNSGELWHIVNGGNSWAHNVHIHFTEGVILLRDNKLPPIWEQFSRKDVYRVGSADGGDGSSDMWIYLKFEDDTGSYMMHCHNTMHEDHAMLLRWDIQEDSCVEDGIPTHLPTWNGVLFMNTFGLPTFRSGINKNNEEYRNPRSIINTLRKIRRNVPQINSGEVYVNGLGEALQNMAFKSLEGTTGFFRDPLGSGIRGVGSNILGVLSGGTLENTSENTNNSNNENQIEENLSECISCNCNRALNIEINGTIQTAGWFDNESNQKLDIPKIVKFKPGETIIIKSTSSQEHGFILKQNNVGNKDDDLIAELSKDIFSFENLKTIVNDHILTSENNIVEILNEESIPNENELWTKAKQIEALTVYNRDIIEFGRELNTNNIGIPFLSKSNDIIAKFRIKDNAQETSGGTGGAGICSIHGTSMAFIFDICKK